jgi:hypothetical protein
MRNFQRGKRAGESRILANGMLAPDAALQEAKMQDFARDA